MITRFVLAVFLLNFSLLSFSQTYNTSVEAFGQMNQNEPLLFYSHFSWLFTNCFTDGSCNFSTIPPTNGNNLFL